MDITLWEPPHRCHVLHTGRLVRGTGAFEVEPRGERQLASSGARTSSCRSGSLGRLGWPLVRPFFAFGVQLSPEAFARWVEAGRPAKRAA